MKPFPDINTRTSLVAISFVKGEIKIFQNITWPYVDQVIKWSEGHMALRVGTSDNKSSPYPTKFGVDTHCVTGDIIGLICHVIS